MRCKRIQVQSVQLHEFRVSFKRGRWYSSHLNWILLLSLQKQLQKQRQAPTAEMCLVDTPNAKSTGVGGHCNNRGNPKLWLWKGDEINHLRCWLSAATMRLNGTKHKHPKIVAELWVCDETKPKRKLRVLVFRPWDLNIPAIIDRTVALMSDLVVANIDGKHYFQCKVTCSNAWSIWFT